MEENQIVNRNEASNFIIDLILNYLLIGYFYNLIIIFIVLSGDSLSLIFTDQTSTKLLFLFFTHFFIFYQN